MKNSMLYFITIAVWGSTFLAIKYQLGVVDPMVSVIYRFGLAAVLLTLFCYFTYAIMIVPVVALILSSFFEGYAWNLTAVSGLLLVVGGNYFALKKPGMAKA